MPVWATGHVAWPKLGQSQGFRVNLALCESGVVLDLFGPQSLFSKQEMMTGRPQICCERQMQSGGGMCVCEDTLSAMHW